AVLGSSSPRHGRCTRPMVASRSPPSVAGSGRPTPCSSSALVDLGPPIREPHTPPTRRTDIGEAVLIDVHAHQYPDAYLDAVRRPESGLEHYIRDDGRLVVLQDGA